MALLRREWSLLLALVLGTWIRVIGLPAQILVGDEWHALSKAASSDWVGILTTFGRSDHSIPVALYFEVAGATVGLSDWTIRAPFLIAGLAMLIVLPLAARLIVDRLTSAAFAWLLAASPMLVFYTRFARPYIIACLFAVLAVILFHGWADSGTGRRRFWALAAR